MGSAVRDDDEVISVSKPQTVQPSRRRAQTAGGLAGSGSMNNFAATNSPRSLATVPDKGLGTPKVEALPAAARRVRPASASSALAVVTSDTAQTTKMQALPTAD